VYVVILSDLYLVSLFTLLLYGQCMTNKIMESLSVIQHIPTQQYNYFVDILSRPPRNIWLHMHFSHLVLSIFALI